jgi:hypothetical protein
MVTELRIYFEGDARLKPGFRRFFGEIEQVATTRRCRLNWIATNGTPVDDYHSGLKANPNAWNVLLLDSDTPADRAFAEMCRTKGLESSHAGSVFWMVQIMESWFLADLAALRTYFCDRFPEAAAKGNPKVEEIPKADVMSRLENAAGGKYHKVRDGGKLLALIDSEKVRRAAPNCDRMFSAILKALA